MSERTPLDSLTAAVTAWFRRHADRFNLQEDAITARYILNWGGFVNASFTVTDGKTSFHLKLADEEGSQVRLEGWRELNELLSDRYHAPRMVDWIEIPDTPFAGPLFEYIAGSPADLKSQPGIRKEVMDLLSRLHADTELARLLSGEDTEDFSCSDYFLSVYIDRFDEDLRIIAGDLPPFVSLGLLDWMMGETRELEGLARELPAFQHPADYPTHGDLWASNILVTEAGRWYIIDWDDLALGDPALEYAIFLGPLWRDNILPLKQLEDFLPADSDLRERFRFCLRALLLDEIIDNLADWVECTFAPEHQEDVRAEKERKHHDALDLYRRIFP
jgi:fructosamine-3-kinase